MMTPSLEGGRDLVDDTPHLAAPIVADQCQRPEALLGTAMIPQDHVEHRIAILRGRPMFEPTAGGLLIGVDEEFTAGWRGDPAPGVARHGRRVVCILDEKIGPMAAHR